MAKTKTFMIFSNWTKTLGLDGLHKHISALPGVICLYNIQCLYRFLNILKNLNSATIIQRHEKYIYQIVLEF